MLGVCTPVQGLVSVLRTRLMGSDGQVRQGTAYQARALAGSEDLRAVLVEEDSASHGPR